MDRKATLDEIRRNIKHSRDGGGQPKRVRMHSSMRQLVEAEYAIEHRDGEMFIAGVPVVADDAVAYDEYEIDT